MRTNKPKITENSGFGAGNPNRMEIRNASQKPSVTREGKERQREIREGRTMGTREELLVEKDRKIIKRWG